MSNAKTKQKETPEVKAPRKSRGRPRKYGEIEHDMAAELKANAKRMYSLIEVREMLGISSTTAHQWMREGRFTGVAWAGTRWLFEPDFKVKEAPHSGQTMELMKRLIPAETKAE